MKNIKFNLKNFEIDAISKFNFYNKNYFVRFNSFIVFSKLNMNESNFIRDFFFLSKLFFFWFNTKLSILKVIVDKNKVFNKGNNKSSLIFFFGCTIRGSSLIIKHLDYILNIFFYEIKKIDGVVNYTKVKNGFIFYFFNSNFLLGFKSEYFININLKINIFFNFFSNIKYMQKGQNLNTRVINFYEKIFF